MNSKPELVDLSVVIPVYNNQNTIEPLCDQLLTRLDLLNLTFEIILVNDASKDSSKQLIKQLEGGFTRIRGIHLPENQGQNMAIFEGLKLAKGKLIVSMDADLQDDPKMITALLQMHDTGTDIVFVKRIGKYQSGSRMLTSSIFKSFLQLLTGLHRKAGSYYLMSSALAQKMINMDCRYPIMTVMAYSLACQVKYLPAERGNNEGVSSYTFRRRCHYALRATYCALQCRWYHFKLKE